MRNLIILILISFLIDNSNIAQSYFDDFESYLSGDYLTQSSNKWKKWDCDTSNTGDVKVTNVNAYSGANSIYFSSVGYQKIVLPFDGIYETGNFLFDCWIFVETDSVAGFNFQENWLNGSFLMGVYLDSGNISIFNYGGAQITGSYPINNWFNLKIDIDLIANSWELLINGVSQGSYINNNNWSIGSLYIGNNNTRTSFYIDDVSYNYNTGPSSLLPNLQPLGYLDLKCIHNSMLSDIWGWVDGIGNEYAIVGLNNGTSVVDVTDPTNPFEVFYEPGMNSIWRDIKTYNGYAYVTTMAENGLLIIDLNTLPGNTNLSTYYYTDTSPNGWLSAHNLYIDENGICYIFGSSRGNGGCIMFDLNSNPTNPTEIGEIDNWYVHDGMARGDTLYLANIFDGFMSIWDVSDVNNIQILAQQTSIGSFTHNLWISDDGNYIYTTDEISDGYIGEYDISNFGNIVELDQTQSSPGDSVTPHNSHFINDYLVTSYYTDGVVIHDVSNKGNMVEVGNFDTSPWSSGSGLIGCWGVYPWLPSGNIIASDMQNGLYILDMNYSRGCYLEGLVIDISNSNPINGAVVEIINTSVIDQTSIVGKYAVGIAEAGSYDVVYSHPQYVSDTALGVSSTNGNITIQNMQLSPNGVSYPDLIQVQSILINPNPTNDLVTLDINGYNGSIQTQVYDLSGRLLKSTNSTTISLKNYAKGIYVFRVSYGDIVEELKVVKD